MSNHPTASLMEHFSALEDPRSDFGKRHLLLDIIVIAICAVICGADNWVEVELFGRTKEQWLRTFLKLPHGIPSHDTFSRVFRRLDPEQFQRCFRSWIEAVQRVTKGQALWNKVFHRASGHCRWENLAPFTRSHPGQSGDPDGQCLGNRQPVGLGAGESRRPI